jgi:hypothetical protein
MFSSNKRLTIISLCIASLLLLPIVAIQFTDEVKWTLSDFVVAGILLLVAGLAVEFTMRKIKTTKLRVVGFVAPAFSILTPMGRTCRWHLRNTNQRALAEIYK